MSIRKVFIGLMWLTVAACTKAPELAERPAPALLQIDSLMWQRPDSALALLLPYFDTCRDAMIASPTDDADNALETHSMRLYDRHYANLLLAELLYKNDYAQANRTALQQAVSYFDSLADTPTTTFLAARTHYINGVGYYENDSAVQACKEYILALEIMEEYFDEKELVGEKARFVAFTYTHLAGLFSDQYLHEQAIYFGNRALDYYHRYNATPWHIAWIYNEIGSNYHMLCDFNKADSLYDLAINVLPDTNNLIYRDIVVLKAFLLYNKVKQAKMPLQQLKSLLLLSESEKEYLARCAIIGEIYYHEMLYDSAWTYLKRVFQNSSNTESRKQAAEWLVEICEAQGREADAIEYATFLVPFANLNENQGSMKSQLTELCHEYEQKKQETLHQNKLKNTMRNGGFIILSIVSAFLVGFIVYLIKSKRRMAAERQTHKMQQAALASKLKKSNETLRELENLVASQNATREEARNQADFSAFKESPVCSHILEVVGEQNFKPKMDCAIYKDYALDRKQLEALVEAADRHLAQFTVRVQTQYPKLTDDDMRYCCLYLLGLKEADISALMQKAYSTVCERSRKIKGILGTEGELCPALRSLI